MCVCMCVYMCIYIYKYIPAPRLRSDIWVSLFTSRREIKGPR